MSDPGPVRRNGFILNRQVTAIFAGLLLAILAILLVTSSRHISQAFDEANHLGAGFAYWKHGDV